MTTTVPLSVAEQTEIRAYAAFSGGVAEPSRRRFGIGSLDLGPALAITVREDANNFFNRAGGFGAGQPVDAEIVGKVVDFYREQGVPAGSLMIAPSVFPPDWSSIVEKFQLTEGSRFVKLGCDVEVAAAAAERVAGLDPSLRIGTVEPRQAREWATAMMPTLGFAAPGMIDVAEACVGQTDWRQYAVWEGEKIVGVGSIFINGDCADMFGGATLDGWRGRGVQSALLAARVLAAREAGCRWMVAEAFAEGPGEHNSSLHNMLKIGFERLFERVAWTWHA